MKPLLTTGIWLLAVVVLLHTGLVTPTLTAVTLFYYSVLVAGLLLAWRFHSSRVFFALLVLFLAEHAVAFFSAGNIPGSGPGRIALDSVGVLLPFNLAILSLGRERGFTFSSIVPPSLLLFVQSVIVAVLCRPPEPGALPHSLHHPVPAVALPFSTLLAFAAAAVVLLVRFLLLLKPIDSAFLWTLAASFLALDFGGVGRIPTAYFATAGFIMGVSIVETSYLLAYHDELTTLPSRRAFNDALLRLEPPYSIAMVDIDHFKRFNDTYGHDTGDQVLRLVAARLARVTGGGQAHRCGGEEFAILFPGKTTKDLADHLEELRAAIEAATFRLRDTDRREIPRGPDRRNGPRARGRTRTGRTRTGRAIRELTQAADANLLSVTVSIGVASSTPEKPETSEKVVQAADRALYRAKAAGRNCVEADAIPRRRARAKTAGIA
jgi:GGDEF domain-containing protein